jgi:hypothetical protein
VPWSPDAIEKLKALAEAGVSCARIASKLKRTMAAVRTVARENGIRLKTPRQVRESYGLSTKWSSNRSF